jgi:hypothetical protein
VIADILGSQECFGCIGDYGLQIGPLYKQETEAAADAFRARDQQDLMGEPSND